MKTYYEDNLITIYHGDCRHLEDSGLVVTDPPYNVGYHYNEYADDLADEEYYEMLKDVCGDRFVMIHYAESLFNFALANRIKPEKLVAWVYSANTPRQWRGVAWFGCKPDFRLDGQEYKNQEDKRIVKRIEAGQSAKLYDWWNIEQVKNVSREKTEHPCQIPLKVMKRILKITPIGPIIDPFMGSGTTLRAAKDLGLRAIGCEMDEKYCEIAAKRMAQEVLL